MYGVDQGWVAHGFVDGRAQGYLYGDTQWALCVTCGAWAATFFFEQLLVNDLSGLGVGGGAVVGAGAGAEGALLGRAVVLLRGVALFFEKYLWALPETPPHSQLPHSLPAAGAVGNNSAAAALPMLHTGPTSSPENSYRVHFAPPPPHTPPPPLTTPRRALHSVAPPLTQPHPGPPAIITSTSVKAQARKKALKSKKIPVPPTYRSNHLALSPAIDASVLRQTASALRLAVKWAQQLQAQAQGLEKGGLGLSAEQLREDSILGKSRHKQ
ncbi:hypothetical protein B484DRAFT_222827 [Ochromonadaceae sp. CCMP2298]|nr:hypothetical protein B484DRAFT_222827 [Ochromonadaceae sp. CCMP2298]